MAVLALAYVMNLSGQTTSLGAWLAGAGGAFAILSPILGWIGVAVTGRTPRPTRCSGPCRCRPPTKAGLDPVLMAAANTSGGVLGKMVSPQNLAIAAAAVGMAGREGDIFRKVIGWSLGLLRPDVRHRRAAVDPGARLDGALGRGGRRAVAPGQGRDLEGADVDGRVRPLRACSANSRPGSWKTRCRTHPIPRGQKVP